MNFENSAWACATDECNWSYSFLRRAKSCGAEESASRQGRSAAASSLSVPPVRRGVEARAAQRDVRRPAKGAAPPAACCSRPAGPSGLAPTSPGAAAPPAGGKTYVTSETGQEHRRSELWSQTLGPLNSDGSSIRASASAPPAGRRPAASRPWPGTPPAGAPPAPAPGGSSPPPTPPSARAAPPAPARGASGATPPAARRRPSTCAEFKARREAERPRSARAARCSGPRARERGRVKKPAAAKVDAPQRGGQLRLEGIGPLRRHFHLPVKFVLLHGPLRRVRGRPGASEGSGGGGAQTPAAGEGLRAGIRLAAEKPPTRAPRSSPSPRPRARR